MSGVRGWGFGVRMVGILAVACNAVTACAPSVGETPKAGAAMSRAIIDPYLRIQEALAKDSIDGIRVNAGDIATATTALGAPAFKIDTSALQLASAGDLADARAKFGVLSDAIVTYMTGLHLTPPSGVRLAYCPMVAKPWLQEGTTLANPYYGSGMPSCGEFR